MAHQVVRLPDEFLALEATDRHEGRVAVGDAALQIGGGDEGHALGDDEFLVGDGQVGAHGISRMDGPVGTEHPGQGCSRPYLQYRHAGR
ncbi:hypothetical protein D9M68_819860 [compost metagenome]